jgi:hypothetical protein
MLKFIIDKAPVAAKSAKGNDYKKQEAYVQLYAEDGTPEKFPRRTELLFRASESGYAPGEYTLAPQSLRVGQYDRLELGRIALLPWGEGQGVNPAGREAGRK